MVDRPIIFSAPMVRALLEGRKTMTRRLAWKPLVIAIKTEGRPVEEVRDPSPWQRVQPGDRLWVREAWNVWNSARRADEWWVTDAIPKEDPREHSRANLDLLVDYQVSVSDAGRRTWRPSIHMPRWASRLTLTVTAVKVERLQDISEADCDAEGFGGDWPHKVAPELFQDAEAAGRLTLPECFARLWNSLHGSEAWDANPEVVVLSFTVERRNVDAR